MDAESLLTIAAGTLLATLPGGVPNAGIPELKWPEQYSQRDRDAFASGIATLFQLLLYVAGADTQEHPVTVAYQVVRNGFRRDDDMPGQYL
jgi:hypothetical protein